MLASGRLLWFVRHGAIAIRCSNPVLRAMLLPRSLSLRQRGSGSVDFIGVIIEESLERKDVLKKVKIVKTKVENVTEKHKTPWIKKWTLHTIEIPANRADAIAKELSESLDSQHSWYADFKNGSMHYIIFRGKIFKVDRTKKEQYDEVTRYGVSLGIPCYQLDFSPDIE